MKTLDYYLKLPYKISVKRLEDGDFYAQFDEPELTKKALMAGWGASYEEAIKDLWDAFACYAEDAIAHNEIIPEPQKQAKSYPTKRYAITMKENVMDDIDSLATKLGLSRSAIIAVGMQNYIKTFAKA